MTARSPYLASRAAGFGLVLPDGAGAGAARHLLPCPSGPGILRLCLRGRLWEAGVRCAPWSAWPSRRGAGSGSRAAPRPGPSPQPSAPRASAGCSECPLTTSQTHSVASVCAATELPFLTAFCFLEYMLIACCSFLCVLGRLQPLCLACF